MKRVNRYKYALEMSSPPDYAPSILFDALPFDVAMQALHLLQPHAGDAILSVFNTSRKTPYREPRKSRGRQRPRLPHPSFTRPTL